mgnify:CR=1 FL=1
MGEGRTDPFCVGGGLPKVTREMSQEDIRDIRLSQMIAIQGEAFRLFARKNTDYGDAFAEHGPVGVLVRLGDKLRRAVSVSSSGVTLVGTEKLRDTLLDLHNYAAMAVMLLDEGHEE